MIHATTWWKLGNMFSEKSQVQKPIYYVIPFMGFIWTFMECLEYANLFRQEIKYWLSPNPGIKPGSPSLQADSLPSEPPGKCKYVKSH